MRTLRPVHAAIMLVAGFLAAQAIGGVFAIAGLGLLWATGGIEGSTLAGPQGVTRILASPLVLIPSAVGSSLGFAAVAVGAPLVLRVPVRAAIAWRRAPVVAWVLGPIGAVGLGAVADQAVFYFARAFPWATLGVLGAFGDAARVESPIASAAVWFGMAIVPGTCEEIFFRGAVQGALASRWRGAAAVSLTAAVFGAIHLDPPQAIGAAILGLYLGFLARETGSIGPSIAAHVLNNSLAWVAANFLTDLDFGYGSPNPTPWAIVGGGAALCLACAAGVRFGRRAKPE